MIIIWLLAFVVAITIHEASHAWMADHLGDPTARIEGRLSLNPLVHYDPVGTTLLLALVILRAIGVPVIPFGWAKPVKFDPYNLANPRRDAALISFAGPLANLSLASFLAIILKFTGSLSFAFLPLYDIFFPIILLNIALAIFNLIPIHPLDGGKVLVGLLPKKEAYDVDKFLSQYGLILLLFLIFPTFGGTSVLSIFISPLINLVLQILVPGNQLI